jgi:hypothetical protein
VRRKIAFCIKSKLIFGETSFFLQETEEFAPLAIFEHEKEFPVILEAFFHAHDAGVADVGEHVPLSDGVFGLSFLF